MILARLVKAGDIDSMLLKIRKLIGQFDGGIIELIAPLVHAINVAEACRQKCMSRPHVITTKILVVENEKLVLFWIRNVSLRLGRVPTDGVVSFLDCVRIKQVELVPRWLGCAACSCPNQLFGRAREVR